MGKRVGSTDRNIEGQQVWVIKCTDEMGHDRWYGLNKNTRGNTEVIWEWAPTERVQVFTARIAARRPRDKMRTLYPTLKIWTERIDLDVFTAARKLVMSEYEDE